MSKHRIIKYVRLFVARAFRFGLIIQKVVRPSVHPSTLTDADKTGMLIVYPVSRRGVFRIARRLSIHTYVKRVQSNISRRAR